MCAKTAYVLLILSAVESIHFHGLIASCKLTLYLSFNVHSNTDKTFSDVFVKSSVVSTSHKCSFSTPSLHHYFILGEITPQGFIIFTVFGNIVFNTDFNTKSKNCDCGVKWLRRLLGREGGRGVERRICVFGSISSVISWMFRYARDSMSSVWCAFQPHLLDDVRCVRYPAAVANRTLGRQFGDSWNTWRVKHRLPRWLQSHRQAGTLRRSPWHWFWGFQFESWQTRGVVLKNRNI